MEKYPTCGGSSQSPINIIPESASPASGSAIVFKDYDYEVKMAFKNEGGHTGTSCLYKRDFEYFVNCIFLKITHFF